MTEIQSDVPLPPTRGRPPKNGNQSATREPTRDGTRDKVFYGRDGEVLTRKQSALSDPYTLPPELKDRGWDYQWNTVSVTGDTEVVVHQDSMMQSNGWRPVPADRPGFKERFGMADNKKYANCIIIGGLRLDERPMGLTEEAKRQEYAAATGQIRDRDAALKGGKANLEETLRNNQMGMAQTGYKGRKTSVQIDIDPEAPQPGYQYGTDD